SLPDSSGIDSFKSMREAAVNIPVIILSGLTDMNVALDAITLGAQDYLIKGDFDEKLLAKTILYSMERMNTINQLKESNERYNLISQATNDMVWDWDLLTGKVYRNKEGWKKIFRGEQKDLEVGCIDDWDSRIHPEDAGKVELVNEEIQKSVKDFFEVECRMLRDDGTYVYIHDRGNIIRNAVGKAVRLIGATQDITQRKEAELQLDKSEKRFRSLVQNSSDLVTIVNERGYYLYCSPAAKRVLGYDPEFIEGKNAFTFIHPDDIDRLKINLSKNKTAKFAEMPSFRFKNAKGEWRWLESKISDMSDNPEVKGYVFNSRDVTERKNAEEEIKNLYIKEKEAEEILKASEERYRYLFNNSPASIIIWDINTLQILEVNNTAVEQHGYSREEFLSKTVMDQSPPEHHGKLKDFIERVRQKNDFKSVITSKYLNKSGEEIYLSIASHRIQYKGRAVIMALATDVTENVSLERILEEERVAKHQEITNAVISAQEQERQELGGELHDNINQILAGSLLYLGLAQKESTAKHPYFTETETLISSAITEIRNLSHSLIPPSLNESELLGAINNIIEVTQQTSEMRISLQSFGFDESNVSDKLKLSIYRIIQEQFNNILKHAGAQRVIVGLFQDKERIKLSIKDDGVGFDTGKKANGVGLMNIKTRASLFNGEVIIISSPGKGCEIKVLFN
ncbi:MAG TPA: PAS domain S-box protein, partial [Ferruginibacter sp.]|nr:PAS domain S-box protein [Ferruginibacter sp.]